MSPLMKILWRLFLCVFLVAMELFLYICNAKQNEAIHFRKVTVNGLNIHYFDFLYAF